MQANADSEATSSESGDDALRELCFADAVFRQRYEGWSVLGRGPWATVVRTRSRDLGHEIALKVFVNVDPELLERVRHEVRAVLALATPYLVRTYTLFDRGTIAWFEMELVEGPNLQRELDRLAAAGERLALPRAYDIALAVSRCVWHAHRYGVLHRDIKPANILLPVSGRPPAKLGDFGVARLAELASSTPSGAITGTPTFASPEALTGEDVGTPHDVYALGATLYTLFAGGRLPYSMARGESIASLRRLRLAERVKPLREFNPEIERRLECVLTQALAPNPMLRPPVEKVVLALESAQARRSPTAGEDHAQWTGSSGRPWRFLAAGVGLMAFGFWRRHRSQRRNDGRPTAVPNSFKEEPCSRGESPR